MRELDLRPGSLDRLPLDSISDELLGPALKFQPGHSRMALGVELGTPPIAIQEGHQVGSIDGSRIGVVTPQSIQRRRPESEGETATRGVEPAELPQTFLHYCSMYGGSVAAGRHMRSWRRLVTILAKAEPLKRGSSPGSG